VTAATGVGCFFLPGWATATGTTFAGVLPFAVALLLTVVWPFAGATAREDGTFATDLAGALDAFGLVDDLAAGDLTFIGAFAAGLAGALAAETLVLAFGLAAVTDAFTALAGFDAVFLEGTPFGAVGAVRTGDDFTFDFTVFPTEPALDDLTFFAAIFSNLENQLKLAAIYNIRSPGCQSLIRLH